MKIKIIGEVHNLKGKLSRIVDLEEKEAKRLIDLNVAVIDESNSEEQTPTNPYMLYKVEELKQIIKDKNLEDEVKEKSLTKKEDLAKFLLEKFPNAGEE